jgi:hypothetical protein
VRFVAVITGLLLAACALLVLSSLLHWPPLAVVALVPLLAALYIRARLTA